MRPPIEQPITMGFSSPSADITARIMAVYCAEVS